MSNYTPQNAWKYSPQTGTTDNPGPFLAEVMRNDDPMYSGRLLVYIPYYGGNPESESSWHLVRYMSPYYGIQPLSNRLTGEPGETIESYGMWMTPPDTGVKVLVMFINGDRSEGVWIGCLPEIGSHGAVPGQDKGDYDLYTQENYPKAVKDVKSVERPEHSTAPTFETQGLKDDKVRGPITSSSLRDTPSKVFGFNTPGSHSFVMDDGDEDGNSKLVRIRTAAGNQIMMNDDSGNIYLINAQGTGWIDISPSGQIDVYGAAGINMASEGDINLHANKDVNIHAGNNVKVVAGKGTKVQGTEELLLHGKKTKLEGVASLDLHSCEEIKITSYNAIYMKAFGSMILEGKCFRWNSGSAKEAEQVPPEQPTDVSGYQTTVARAPSKEPYKEHDNGSGGQGGGASGAAGGGGAGGVLGGASLDSVPSQVQSQLKSATASVPKTSIAQVQSSLDSLPAGLVKNATAISSGAKSVKFEPKSSSMLVSDVAKTAASPKTTIADVQSALDSAPAGLGASSAAEMAQSALGVLGGQQAMSSLPTQPGGGGTSGFADGSNCSRPADGGSGGGGAPGGAGSNPDNLDTSLGQSQEDLQKTYDTLRDEGLTHEQAIGVMANMNRESGFRPGAIGDNGNSYGLFQYNRGAGRLDPMVASVPDWQTNAAGQISYAFNSDPQGISFKNSSFSSSLAAANAFTSNFERPLATSSYIAAGGYNSRIVPRLESQITRR